MSNGAIGSGCVCVCAVLVIGVIIVGLDEPVM